MKKSIPVLQIENFQKSKDYFYANSLSRHLKVNKDLISHPHKHDFYLTVFFLKGSGFHVVDFQKFPVKSGSVFLLKPGQTHYWELSKDCEGYIFFHADFSSTRFFHHNLNDFPFYSSINNSPEIVLKEEEIEIFNLKFKAIFEEFESEFQFKSRKLVNLIDSIYIDLSRINQPIINQARPSVYLEYLNKFTELIEKNYKIEKSPIKYAEMIFISAKHLNRITKETLNKTTGDVISERIILETKRLISHSNFSLTEISGELGFEDFAYFSRYFKKKTGMTLSEFKSTY